MVNVLDLILKLLNLFLLLRQLERQVLADLYVIRRVRRVNTSGMSETCLDTPEVALLKLEVLGLEAVPLCSW